MRNLSLNQWKSDTFLWIVKMRSSESITFSSCFFAL